jgi:hypothetical protein
MNICNVFLLSKIKSSLNRLYYSDVKSMTKHLDDFFDDQGIGASLKFTVYALYHLPLTFSNFGVFEPFFKPFHKGEIMFDLSLNVRWILDSIGPLELSEVEKTYKINEWIDGFEYRIFYRILWDYVQQRISIWDEYSIRDNIEMIFDKFKFYPKKVLRKVIFEEKTKFLPLVVYIYFNPSLRKEDCVDDRVLNGLLKLYPSGVEATRSFEFLNQTIFDLESYKPMIISEIFTDVVRVRLEKFRQSKLETSSESILI